MFTDRTHKLIINVNKSLWSLSRSASCSRGDGRFPCDPIRSYHLGTFLNWSSVHKAPTLYLAYLIKVKLTQIKRRTIRIFECFRLFVQRKSSVALFVRTLLYLQDSSCKLGWFQSCRSTSICSMTRSPRVREILRRTIKWHSVQNTPGDTSVQRTFSTRGVSKLRHTSRETNTLSEGLSFERRPKASWPISPIRFPVLMQKCSAKTKDPLDKRKAQRGRTFCRALINAGFSLMSYHFMRPPWASQDNDIREQVPMDTFTSNFWEAFRRPSDRTRTELGLRSRPGLGEPWESPSLAAFAACTDLSGTIQ